MFQFLKKALESITYPRDIHWALSLPRTKFDYAREVGTGLGSNVIMAPVQWIMRTFPEAPPIVMETTKDGEEKRPEHPMLQLLENPNPHYPGELLWMATLLSWTISGNAYWLKLRNGMGKPVELWYVPHWMIEPKAPQDGSQYLTHYEYIPNGMPIRIEVEDVVHFRWGLNPQNIRKGLSPLDSVIREVFTDDEAANFSAAILKNMGIPGVIISPESDSSIVSEDVPKAVKEKYQETFGGDNRGGAMVMKSPTKIQQFGFNPSQMNLGKLRNIPEERVCAVLGLPAAVVGFGTGLQQTKVGATMAELRKLAWTGNIIPTQRLFGGMLNKQLLIDFEPDMKRHKVRFDNTEVQALQEDRNERAKRIDTAVRGGYMKLSRAQEQMGLEVDPDADVYLMPAGAFPITSYAGELLVQETDNGKAFKGDVSPTSTMTEDRIIASAPRRRPTSAQIRLQARFTRDHNKMSRSFEKVLDKQFAQLGRLAAEAAEGLLKAALDIEKKDPQDTLDADQIIESMPLLEFEEGLRQKYQAQYLRTAKVTIESINAEMGLAVNLPDTVAREIIATGGRRLGLLNIRGQTRARLFQELAEGRSLGEGVPELVARIRGKIPAGRWSSPQIRARIIARTETKYAQRKSALEAYKQEDTVTQALVLDARLGDTDDECEALNNTVVSLEDAEQLANDEHPNGQRDFVPIIGE